MGASGEHRRRARDRARGAASSRAFLRLLAAAGLSAAASSPAVAGALAAPSGPAVLDDPVGDVSGPLDIERMTLSRASDGRLRAVLTFAAKITPKLLLASSGPPGSACLRIWTAADADPVATRPDRFVCVTARSAEELRAGVFRQGQEGLPERVGSASAKLSAGGRSLVVRVSQSALGRPARIRFGVESTRPGCERTTCIDTAPEAGETRSFRLR